MIQNKQDNLRNMIKEWNKLFRRDLNNSETKKESHYQLTISLTFTFKSRENKEKRTTLLSPLRLKLVILMTTSNSEDHLEPLNERP